MISSSPVWLAFKSDIPAMYKALRLFALLAILFSLYYLLMLVIAYWFMAGLFGIVDQLLASLLSLFYGG